MNKLIKKMAVILLGLTTMAASASDKSHYATFSYNVHSINKAMTDKQCAELSSIARYQTIVDDKVIFEKNPNYTLSEYQRTNVTYLSKDRYLFTGYTHLTFVLDGKKQTARDEVAFVLSIPEQKIQGSFILVGYCKGNLLGVDETLNQWPPPSD